jgi:nucleoside 2-deoxyribosyltransferase
MPAETSRKAPAILELTLLGFLVSLILKATLDGVFAELAKVEEADWLAFDRVFLNRQWPVVLIFFLTLLRFVYGAYRFHESETGELGLVTRLWNIVGMMGLFILFYLAGLAIKAPVFFFTLIFFFHLWDLVWFFVVVYVFKSLPDELDNVAVRFMFLDAVTVVPLLLLFVFSGAITDKPPGGFPLWLGCGLLVAVGVLDFLWNRRFYFPPGPTAVVNVGGPHGPETVIRNDAPSAGQGREEPVVYFAGPLFTQAEWQWNARLAEKLRSAGLEVVLPQEAAEPMLQGRTNFDPVALFKGNFAAIDRARVLVAVLDGADPDSGTCWECGYAFKLGRPVIGVRTDLRSGGDDPAASINLMLSQSCAGLITVPFEKRQDIDWIAERIVGALRGLNVRAAGHPGPGGIG